MDEPDPVYDHHRKENPGCWYFCYCYLHRTHYNNGNGDRQGRGETARWNNKETQQFIQFLVDHKSEGGDNGTFKNKPCWLQHSLLPLIALWVLSRRQSICIQNGIQ